MKVVRLQIPSGEPGTDATVRIIRQLIESGKRSLKIRYFAEWILNLYNVGARDRVGEIAAIHDWAKKNIRYVQDPYRVEYVQTPERLLVTRTGDCDDFTALVGSLVEAIGYPVDIKVVAKQGRKEFHHVYPIARIGTESVGLDASMPVPLGYEAPGISRSKIYRSESKMLDVFGNGGLGREPMSLDLVRANGVSPRIIIGGNGIRKRIIEPIVPPPVVNGGPVIYPPPPTDDMILPTEGEPRPRFPDETIIHPGAPTEAERIAARERIAEFGPIIYLKLGESYTGMDAKRRMDTGYLRPATPNLMLVYKPVSQGPAGAQTFRFDPSGTVTAVLRTVNGVVEPTVPGAERVVVPEYDVFGQPVAQPIVVTTPGVPSAGIDTTTLLMIGGGVLALMLLMRK